MKKNSIATCMSLLLGLAVLVLFCIYLDVEFSIQRTSDVNVDRKDQITAARNRDTSLGIAFQMSAIKDRNNLSRTLNKVLEKLGQLQCEQTKGGGKISETGGWCQKKATGYRPLDKRLTTHMARMFQGKTVGSFGDGPGLYKRLLLSTGKVKTVDAYDGAPYSYSNTNGSVHFLDLTIPQFGLPAYDWVMCIEVIEHIPAEHERIVLSNLFRHAREGVVVSWATKGQRGGFYHVNCQNFDYVNKTFHDMGFDFDSDASQMLHNKASIPHIKRNIKVFRRSSRAKFEDQDV